jgi:hypothetical protein
LIGILGVAVAIAVGLLIARLTGRI